MSPLRIDPGTIAARSAAMVTLIGALDDTDPAEVGLISEALRDELLPAAGMRNVLVHEYVTINLDRVADATPLARDVFRRYLVAVATFVDDLDR